MLTSYYGFWDYWNLHHKVTFDGANKHIIVNSGESQIDVKVDIYSAWKEWTLLEQNAKFLPAIRVIGGDPINVDTGLYAGDTYFLMNGWQIVIGHEVNLSGVLYHDDAGIGVKPYIVLAGGGIIATVSNLVQTVVVGGNNAGPTAVQIASAVRTELSPELAKINSQIDGLTPNQATMLQEIYALYGLDVSKPLVVTNTSRTAGTISQTINSNQNQTTVTRV